ncbi:PREDICTED: cytochrome P450 71B28-like isoform X2 [Camelina sativa]|uniref:Cytochrome P450 71B28-like isoform X2 n=1 Tax=Camelina sativa TaxID=90675 RepID=A0ABM0X5K8_CAMSA|nr:PREDICTED: cytochrome P450 71B28-like isoform X2 [Camelina sativa]
MSLFLCFLCLLPLILIFLNIFKSSKWKLPPGPKTLPIIGNLHQRRELHPRKRRNLSDEYGPVVLLQYGFVPVVVISSKEAAEEVLKIHDLECCSRPETAGTRATFYNFKDVGFAPYGEEWRVMRKLSVVELFSLKKLQSFRSIREEENDLCVKKLSEFATKRSPVNLEKTLFTLIGNIVCRIGFGINLYDCDFVDEDRIVDLVHKSDEVIGDSLFSDFFPGRIGRLIDRISGQSKRLNNLFSELDTFFQNILDHHLKPGRESSYIIDVMIDMMKKQEKDGDAFKFTTDHLKGMISDIFLAGVGASAATAVSAMTELIRNPKVMKKVQDEIRTTLGDKKERITEEDLNQLHYFKLMVREVFRLHPSAPLLLPRETLSHVKIQGYDIPAKTQIIINAYAIARDPKLWENPDEFNPDRFLDSSIDYKGLNFELIPFGSGRRICPGMTMGIMLVELALLNLLYFFDWGLPEMGEANEIVTGNEDVLNFVQVLHH